MHSKGKCDCKCLSKINFLDRFIILLEKNKIVYNTTARLGYECQVAVFITVTVSIQDREIKNRKVLTEVYPRLKSGLGTLWC